MIITIGTTLYDGNQNEYIIEKSLKSGGFGQVYIALCKSDSQRYAIKTMLNAFSSSEDFKSFKNELETASKVSDDNIVNYIFFHDGTMYDNLPPYVIANLD